MKKLILAIAAMVMVPTTAQAQSSELCPKIGELAGLLMKSRQMGIDKSTVVASIPNGAAYKTAMAMVELAYHTPIYPTTDMKNLSIENFRMQLEYTCMQNFTY